MAETSVAPPATHIDQWKSIARGKDRLIKHPCTVLPNRPSLELSYFIFDLSNTLGRYLVAKILEVLERIKGKPQIL